MAYGKMRSWLSRRSYRSGTVAGHVPDAYSSYIKVISYWENGASLDLTLDGLKLGRGSQAGAMQLAEVVTAQDTWRGTRSLEDVAHEIRDHCRAWFWLPFLRSRANPVDLEFFDSWPLNLLVSLHIKKPARPEP
jgi:hypothetical protein